ncbi:MAG: RNA polymerase sigma factor [Verrucomicrobiales bacterium]|nr:RNA polymerase sigma factor [Verrucomicrobiales bacterium]
MNEPGPTREDRFLALLRPLERELELYARRLLWDPGQLRDAVQNAVLRAFAAFDRYRPDASFRAWILKILTREVFALNRKHARVARHEFQLEPEELAELPAAADVGPWVAAPADLEALGADLEAPMTQALHTLSDNERAVLLLRALGDLRYREISETLDIPMGSVMGDLHRARQKMRAALGRPQAATGSRPSRADPRTDPL